MRKDAERFDLHMSDSDALMWNIEKDPMLRSTIVAVFLLDRPPDWERLAGRIERGTWLIPRMRQRVVTPMLRLGPPFWSADPCFDLRYHLRRVRAPEPSFDAVLDLAATAAMAGFDRARPLWEYTVVEGLPNDQAAMVLKVHHSLTDGVGGMRLLLMLMDFERDAGDPEPLEAVEAPPCFSPFDLVLASLGHRQRRALGIARRTAADTLGAATTLVRRPAEAVQATLRTLESVVEFLAPATTPCSPLWRARSLSRRIGTLEVPLDDLRASAKRVGGSLNDAFVAAVLGGLARYHEFHGEPTEQLRMVMPINVRGEGAPLGGNHFTPARFLVPLGIKDPVERMREVGRLVRRIRAQPAVRLTDALAGVLNQLPTSVTTSLFGAMLKGADVITSNVPGSPVPLYIAGSEVQRMWAIGPLSGAAVNVVLLSHDGTCCIGVNSDAVAVPDTETLLRGLEEGFEEVLTAG